jgi:hypothetical protein
MNHNDILFFTIFGYFVLLAFVLGIGCYYVYNRKPIKYVEARFNKYVCNKNVITAGQTYEVLSEKPGFYIVRTPSGKLYGWTPQRDFFTVKVLY